MPMIKLQSSDDEVFQVDFEIAKASGIIKTIVEYFGQEGEYKEIIPLSKVNTRILKKIIEWATYHKDDRPTEVDKAIGRCNKCSDDISSWDADFLKMDQRTLYELISAANHLEIHNLMDAGCKTLANMLKVTAEVIRETLNTKNDFTSDKVEQVRKQIESYEEE